MTFPSPRVEGLATLRNRDGALVIGAAIGAGIAAQAAIRGGADFLLAISAGRLRIMGGSSPASILPIVETNAFVSEFTRAEILPHCSVPVFFGAAAMDPALDIDGFLSRLRRWGLAGVTNFPSVGHLGSERRQVLDAANLGFDREIDLLRRAQDQGLSAIAYVGGVRDACAVVSAGVDAINLNFGWNQGGVRGVGGGPTIEEVALRAREIFKAVRRINPAAMCFIEGGPVITPHDVLQVSMQCQADGYVGGSTVDRLAMESSVSEKISAFKTVHLLRSAMDVPDRKLNVIRSSFALTGTSDAIRLAAEQVRAAASDVPAVIVGEPGSGRNEIARLLHANSSRADRPLYKVRCNETEELRLASEIFGRKPDAMSPRRVIGLLENANGSSVIVQELESVSPWLFEKFRYFLETGEFARVSDYEALVGDARVLLIIGAVSGSDRGARLVEKGPRISEIVVPPLRDRLEDLPALTEFVLASSAVFGRAMPRMDDSAYECLLRHDWPNNLRELKDVIERGVALAGGRPLTAADIQLGPMRQRRAGDVAPNSERDWILDALRRNKYRRKDTARFLNISRKTLYNKIQKYCLFD